MHVEIPATVTASRSYGWLWAALALPMREDGSQPDRSIRFRLVTDAERLLPSRGDVTADEVRSALRRAREGYAQVCEGSALTWEAAAERAEAAALESRRQAEAVTQEWSPEARFGVGYRHPHTGRGGMRDRDLARQDYHLDAADAAEEAAARYRRQAARARQAAAAARSQH